MKKIVKWTIIAVALIGIIIGASFLYKNLSKVYDTDKLSSTDPTESQSGTESEDFSAPDFTVTDYDGKEVKLSDYKGKPVVINFWATWCGYCKQEMSDFNKAYKNYPDIQFLMVNATDGTETVEKAKAYIEQEKFDFPVVFDTKSEAVNNYYVTGYPATYFVDKDGNLVTYASGMLDYETLEKGIKLIEE